MKYIFVLLLSVLPISAEAQINESGSDPVKMENMDDSLSYFLGLMFGYDIQELPFQINQDLIRSGFISALDGTALYDREETEIHFRQLQQSLQEKEAEKAQMSSAENLEKGRLYLEKISAREGVITTESGLMYEVLTKGDGPMPADTSSVTVHYEGTLIDGTVFDSSYDRGEPATFPLNRVISGWTEGVQLMPVGSTYRLYIPADLGYGPRETGPIPANSVLIFKIELLGIE
jgi:FKBP-type peptidyl-prolyl cis-trans isomerase FkpA